GGIPAPGGLGGAPNFGTPAAPAAPADSTPAPAAPQDGLGALSGPPPGLTAPQQPAGN
ncbi:C4-dicarboxylate ABC transporter, partial [Paracoccus versutus]